MPRRGQNVGISSVWSPFDDKNSCTNRALFSILECFLYDRRRIKLLGVVHALPFGADNRRSSLISDPIRSPGVFPRSNVGKFQVLPIRVCPAMTRCRPASVPL